MHCHQMPYHLLLGLNFVVIGYHQIQIASLNCYLDQIYHSSSNDISFTGQLLLHLLLLSKELMGSQIFSSQYFNCIYSTNHQDYLMDLYLDNHDHSSILLICLYNLKYQIIYSYLMHEDFKISCLHRIFLPSCQLNHSLSYSHIFQTRQIQVYDQKI